MKGTTFLELIVVLGLIGLFVVVTTANLNATQRRIDFDQFAEEIFSSLQKCRWKAFQQRCYTGVFVEKVRSGYEFSFFTDGNGNGIRTVDIADGKDISLYRPIRVYRASGDMEAAILKAGVPEIPPKKGVLNGAGSPIKFGNTKIISFSPNGQSSSGTLYLSCHSQKQMYAIVLYGPTARMSMWKYSNQKWHMVEDR
jgi:hypothetical protein